MCLKVRGAVFSGAELIGFTAFIIFTACMGIPPPLKHEKKTKRLLFFVTERFKKLSFHMCVSRCLIDLMLLTTFG